jgi:hypothetical protein
MRRTFQGLVRSLIRRADVDHARGKTGRIETSSEIGDVDSGSSRVIEGLDDDEYFNRIFGDCAARALPLEDETLDLIVQSESGSTTSSLSCSPVFLDELRVEVVKARNETERQYRRT